MNEIGKLVYFRWHSSNSVSTCPDCRARSGMVKRLSEWVNLGLPTAGVTRCGEFCNCYLESVHMVNGAWEKIGDDSYWHMVIERILSNAKGSKKVEKTETIIERVTESSENDVLPEGQHRAIMALGSLFQAAQAGSFEILAISAGKGNGWIFGADVLQNSVPLWDMTECFLDHDLKTRSVKDLAGVLSSPAWDESKQGIRATLRAVGAGGEVLKELGKVVLSGGLAQRKSGQQSVSLFLTRFNRWESSNTRSAMTINFPGGGNQDTYAGMANHKDATAGDSNWGWINPASMAGDLKSHTSYQFMPGAGDFVGDVLMDVSYADVGSPNVQYALPTLEETAFSAAGGVTKTSYGSAACSGGNYATFAWNTVVETLLMTAAVPTNTLAYYLAFERPFKPIARLQAAWAVTDCWFKAKLIVTGTAAVVYETEWVLFPGNTQLLEFPPVYMPPAGMYETLGLDLAIYAMKATAGVYTMPFDYLQLWPVDGGFRKYKQLAYFGSAGQLLDFGVHGGVFWSNYSLTQERATVVAYGPPIQLLPGRTIVVAIANLTNGTTWLIDDRITFYINQVPTKRNI